MGRRRRYPNDALRQAAYRLRLRNRNAGLHPLVEDKGGRPPSAGPRDETGELLTTSHGVVSLNASPKYERSEGGHAIYGDNPNAVQAAMREYNDVGDDRSWSDLEKRPANVIFTLVRTRLNTMLQSDINAEVRRMLAALPNGAIPTGRFDYVNFEQRLMRAAVKRLAARQAAQQAADDKKSA